MSRSGLARWRLYLPLLVILALAGVAGRFWHHESRPERVVGLSNSLFRLELAILVDYPKAHDGAFPPEDWNPIRPQFSIVVPKWFWNSTVYNPLGTTDPQAPLLLFVDLPGEPHGGSLLRFSDGKVEPLTAQRLHELRQQLSPSAYQLTLDLLKSRTAPGP